MIKKQIADNVLEALDNLGLKHTKEFSVEVPNNPDFGDYSTNAALMLAKENQIAPKQMAEKLAKELRKNKQFKSVEIAGPGFINFRIAPSL